MDSYSYWSKREKAHAELQKASDEEITKQLIANLEASRDEINDRINLFYERYAGSQGITLEESMKRISESDTKAFSKRAKELVKNKDTSDEANRELKLYNATMRINRLEMLKAEIDLELLIATEKNGKLIEKQLKNTAYKEYERQAGILGEMIPVSQKQVLALINSSVNTAGQVSKPVWSQTLWTNQQEMANELNIIIRRAITQGVNVTTAVGRIADRFDSYKSRAKTLLVTETAYVQGLVQLDSFLSAGFDEYVYLSESRACKICKALDGKVFKIDDLEVGKNFYPMHPHCKCSAAPHMSDEEFKEFLNTGRAKPTKQEESEPIISNRTFDLVKMNSENIGDKNRILQVTERANQLISEYEEETGINVLELWRDGKFSNRSDSYNDEHAKFTKYVMNKLGYDKKPIELKDFKGYTAYYRGVSDAPGISADDFVKRFRDGIIDLSSARTSAHGRSFYMGSESVAKSYAESSASGSLIKAYVPDSYKWLDDDIIRSEAKWMNENLESLTEEIGEAAELYQFLRYKRLNESNHELLAMMHGYDGIVANHGLKGTYYSMMNRSIMGVE